MSNNGLICIGLTTLDVVALPIDALPADEGTTLVERIVLAPAGTAAGAAMVAATLGLKSRLASAVGGDLTGRVVRMALEEQGVDLSLTETLPDLPTSTTILAVNSQGGRPNFHAMGAGFFAGVSEATTEAASQTRFLHYGGVGGPRLDGGPGAELLKTAKAAGAVVSCDLISPQPGAMDELRRLLPMVDYFLPSAAEAVMLSGHDDLADAARFFIDCGAGNCIIKAGARGAVAVLDGAVVTVPAYEIKPVDTTSCGDAFCAGFLTGLDRGLEAVDACRFATATAALIAQGPGTLGLLTGVQDVETAMTTLPTRAA
nr:PfkB family carbohydrate kinase [uncultured Brevundimonas sp.]